MCSGNCFLFVVGWAGHKGFFFGSPDWTSMPLSFRTRLCICSLSFLRSFFFLSPPLTLCFLMFLSTMSLMLFVCSSGICVSRISLTCSCRLHTAGLSSPVTGILMNAIGWQQPVVIKLYRYGKAPFFLSVYYYPGQKNHYSQDIHEIDRQCDHEISCDVDSDLQRELATRRYRESRRCQTGARYVCNIYRARADMKQYLPSVHMARGAHG